MRITIYRLMLFVAVMGVISGLAARSLTRQIEADEMIRSCGGGIPILDPIPGEFDPPGPIASSPARPKP